MLSVFPIPEYSVVHEVDTVLNKRTEIAPVVYLMQYDQTIPILAVHFEYNFDVFKIPEPFDANVRMEKPDRTHIYNPALGVSEDRKTLYIGITGQMTAAHGLAECIVEFLNGNGNVVGTSSFMLNISRNPVPADAYESTDEYKSLTEILDEVQKLDQHVQENADKAAESERQAKEYSGNPPIIQRNPDGYWTWWIWNADEQKYEDSGKIAVGNVMYATFMVSLEDGHLYMAHDAAYDGPSFRLNGTHLEVVLNA